MPILRDPASFLSSSTTRLIHHAQQTAFLIRSHGVPLPRTMILTFNGPIVNLLVGWWHAEWGEKVMCTWVGYWVWRKSRRLRQDLKRNEWIVWSRHSFLYKRLFFKKNIYIGKYLQAVTLDIGLWQSRHVVSVVLGTSILLLSSIWGVKFYVNKTKFSMLL